jgi:hypothetical protein
MSSAAERAARSRQARGLVPPVSSSRSLDPHASSPHDNEVLALHVESCSPELLRLARHSASGDCGLSAGVLAAGPVPPSYSLCPTNVTLVTNWTVGDPLGAQRPAPCYGRTRPTP